MAHKLLLLAAGTHAAGLLITQPGLPVHVLLLDRLSQLTHQFHEFLFRRRQVIG